MSRTFQVDPAHTTIGFSIKHMMVATVRGNFGQFEGSVEWDDDPASAQASAVIQAASINTGTPDRDAHLRSADFFDTDRFPTLEFRSDAVRSLGGDRYQVEGEITIHGVTRPLTLEAAVDGRMEDPYGNERVAVTLSGSLDRREFGLVWNQPLQQVGGLTVGNEVKLQADLTLVRALAAASVA